MDQQLLRAFEKTQVKSTVPRCYVANVRRIQGGRKVVSVRVDAA